MDALINGLAGHIEQGDEEERDRNKYGTGDVAGSAASILSAAL